MFICNISNSCQKKMPSHLFSKQSAASHYHAAQFIFGQKIAHCAINGAWNLEVNLLRNASPLIIPRFEFWKTSSVK